MKKIYSLFLIAGFHAGTQVSAQSDYNDVAEIFYSTCTYCHHDGGVAPFPLMNYTQVSSFSNSIHSSVNAGTMPPWMPDTTYTTSGRTVPHYLGENILTEVEKNKILDWITDGVIEGDPAQAPAAPTYGDVTYRLNGNPDLTLQIPTFASNSSSAIPNPYNCFAVSTTLTTDRWLRAFEIIPGNLEAVHHVVITVDTTASIQTDVSGGCSNQGGDFGLGGWTPGAPPTIYPSKAPLKAGMRIPAGSNLIIQMHYAPGSGGKIDSTKIRMFFYPENETDIRPVTSNTLIQDWGSFGERLQGTIVFPAGQVKTRKATPTTSIRPINSPPTVDYSILGVNPHSHSICTSIIDYAFKGTDTIPLISIPNWDFNWEGYYYFPSPVKIPADYTLEAVHVFDNTVNNTHLEGSPVDTQFGPETEDEMLFDSFIYIDYQAGDELIDIKSMIENDTLLFVGIENVTQEIFKTYIYPNPATDVINIYLSEKSTYTARLLNITGQTLLTTGTFIEKQTIDLSGILTGVYILEITDTKTGERSSKKIIVTE